MLPCIGGVGQSITRRAVKRTNVRKKNVGWTSKFFRNVVLYFCIISANKEHTAMGIGLIDMARCGGPGRIKYTRVALRRNYVF